MTAISIIGRLCIWVLSFCKLEALGELMGSLVFCMCVVPKLLCLIFCLFDAIAELTCYGWKYFSMHF